MLAIIVDRPRPGSSKAGDSWREADDLGCEELLPAARLLDMAHAWIMHPRAADAEAESRPKV